MKTSFPSPSKFLLLIYLVVILYATKALWHGLQSRGDLFENAHECLMAKTKDIESEETLWRRFPHLVNQCSVQESLNIRAFANTDEMKYHVMPLGNSLDASPCTIISLGIGKDVDAERAMKEAMPGCQFYGADPVNETNADIFPEVGKFFNIAVGAENGTFRSYILEDIYRYQEVKYTDVATFLRNQIKRKVIDQMMVDIEHAEYPMLPFLLESGEIARQGTALCQINIEIHRPNDKQISQFAEFYRSIMEENQWTFLSTSTIIGHLRLFMINHKHEECRRRYIEQTEEKPSLSDS